MYLEYTVNEFKFIKIVSLYIKILKVCLSRSIKSSKYVFIGPMKIFLFLMLL